MGAPRNFSWIERPHVAAMAAPESVEDLHWLREQGIQVVVSLTEEPIRSDWVNDAGLLAFHVPMVDMEAPDLMDVERCVSAMRRAGDQGMAVVVHCGAGLGRTGVVLACYFVDRGESAPAAVSRVRRLRPGSIETSEQAAVVSDFARRRHGPAQSGPA